MRVVCGALSPACACCAGLRVRACGLLLRGVCLSRRACVIRGGLPNVKSMCVGRHGKGSGQPSSQLGHMGVSDLRPCLLGQAGAGCRAAEGARAAGHLAAACARLASRSPCRSECRRGAERSCAACTGRSQSEQPAGCTAARATAQLRRRARSRAMARGRGGPGRNIRSGFRARSGRRGRQKAAAVAGAARQPPDRARCGRAAARRGCRPCRGPGSGARPRLGGRRRRGRRCRRPR